MQQHPLEWFKPTVVISSQVTNVVRFSAEHLDYFLSRVLPPSFGERSEVTWHPGMPATREGVGESSSSGTGIFA
jgi:hypothetical protein